MKVCILGAKGRVAQRHIKAWEELGLTWEGFDPSEPVDFMDFDLVDICTPIYNHVELIKKVVAAGKPVICEKPIGRTVSEAQELLGLDHKIGIIYQFRFNPKILRLKKQIAAGKFGDIKLVTSTYYRWRGPEYYKDWEGKKDLAGGGTVLNVTIHYLDLLQWIFGYPEEIQGFINTAKDIEVEDSGVAIFKFPKGVIGAYITTTIAQKPKHYEFSVYGTKGQTTIRLQQNEYHKENFRAFLAGNNYVIPQEAIKSLQMAERIIND